MKPILYKSDETTYNHNGLGIMYDVTRCEVTEVRNANYDIELDYQVGSHPDREDIGITFKDIKEGMLVKAKPNDFDEPHVFRITDISKTMENAVMTIRGVSKSRDLVNNLIKSLKLTNQTPTQIFNFMKTEALYPIPYSFNSSIQSTNSIDWFMRNPMNALMGEEDSLTDNFRGEFKWGNSTIDFHARRGNDRVTRIKPGKNLKGFKQNISISGLITRILPYAIIQKDDGKGGQTETKLIGDIVTSSKANQYPISYIVAVDMVQYKDTIENLAQLNQAAATYFTSINPGCDEPNVSMDIDLLDLTDSKEYERFRKLESVQLCDTVMVHVKKFDVDSEVKITSLTYDSLRERTIKLGCGDRPVSNSQALRRDYTHKLNQSLSEMMNEVHTIVMASGDGSYNYYTPDEPANPNKNDRWYKQVGNGKVELYIYDGNYWQAVITEEILDAIKEIAENAANMTEEQRQIIEGINDKLLYIDQKFDDMDAYIGNQVGALDGKLESEKGRIDHAIDKAEQAIEDVNFTAGNLDTLQGITDGLKDSVLGLNTQVNEFGSVIGVSGLSMFWSTGSIDATTGVNVTDPTKLRSKKIDSNPTTPYIAQKMNGAPVSIEAYEYSLANLPSVLDGTDPLTSNLSSGSNLLTTLRRVHYNGVDPADLQNNTEGSRTGRYWAKNSKTGVVSGNRYLGTNTYPLSSDINFGDQDNPYDVSKILEVPIDPYLPTQDINTLNRYTSIGVVVNDGGTGVDCAIRFGSSNFSFVDYVGSISLSYVVGRKGVIDTEVLRIKDVYVVPSESSPTNLTLRPDSETRFNDVIGKVVHVVYLNVTTRQWELLTTYTLENIYDTIDIDIEITPNMIWSQKEYSTGTNSIEYIQFGLIVPSYGDYPASSITRLRFKDAKTSAAVLQKFVRNPSDYDYSSFVRKRIEANTYYPSPDIDSFRIVVPKDAEAVIFNDTVRRNYENTIRSEIQKVSDRVDITAGDLEGQQETVTTLTENMDGFNLSLSQLSSKITGVESALPGFILPWEYGTINNVGVPGDSTTYRRTDFIEVSPASKLKAVSARTTSTAVTYFNYDSNKVFKSTGTFTIPASGEYIYTVPEDTGNTRFLVANKSISDNINISKFNDSIEAMELRINTLEIKTTSTTNTIATMQVSLNGKVDVLEFTQVKTTVSSHTITIANMDGRLVTLDTTINGIQSTVSNKADKTQVTQLANQWTQTTNLANGHTSQINSLGTELNLRVKMEQVTTAILDDKKIKDTRSTNQPPSWYWTNYPTQIATEFKQRTVLNVTGATGTYAVLTTEVPWSGESGGPIKQSARCDNGVFERQSVGSTSWSAWVKVVNSSNVLTQINLSTEGVYIQGKFITLDGTSLISNAVIKTAHIADLSVTSAKISSIDAGKITTGILDAGKITVVNLVITNTMIATNSISGDRITSISGSKINTGTINAAIVTVSNLNASNITTGTINASLINVINLNANNITTGSMNVSRLNGDVANFVTTAWNSAYSSMTASSTGLTINQNTTGWTMNLTREGLFFNANGVPFGSMSMGNLGLGFSIPSGKQITFYKNSTSSGIGIGFIQMRSSDSSFSVNGYISSSSGGITTLGVRTLNSAAFDGFPAGYEDPIHIGIGGAYQKLKFGVIKYTNTYYPALLSTGGKVGILFGTSQLYYLNNGVVYNFAGIKR